MKSAALCNRSRPTCDLTESVSDTSPPLPYASGERSDGGTYFWIAADDTKNFVYLLESLGLINITVHAKDGLSFASSYGIAISANYFLNRRESQDS